MNLCDDYHGKVAPLNIGEVSVAPTTVDSERLGVQVTQHLYREMDVSHGCIAWRGMHHYASNDHWELRSSYIIEATDTLT